MTAVNGIITLCVAIDRYCDMWPNIKGSLFLFSKEVTFSEGRAIPLSAELA